MRSKFSMWASEISGISGSGICECSDIYFEIRTFCKIPSPVNMMSGKDQCTTPVGFQVDLLSL